MDRPGQPVSASHEPAPRPRFRRLAAVLFAVGVASLAAAAGLLVFGLGGDGDGDTASGPGFGNGGFEAVPEASAAAPPDTDAPAEPAQPAQPVRAERPKEACHPIAVLRGRRGVTLLRTPGGRPRLRLSAKTEWGSPRVFGVVRRQGGWLAVQASGLDNGELAWLPARRAISDCVRWSLHADISKRRLVVRENGSVRRRITVAVGRPGNETPTGRFSVTDKLRVTGPGSPYGCCVLALTGHQTNLPPDWPGGDRLAVHHTSDEASIGLAASLGCLRAGEAQSRWLIETVPLGAPIFIRS